MTAQTLQSNSKPRLVIIGGGFGGLAAAEALAGFPGYITVIDRKNHHTFQPLLYQVATAGLSPGEIAAPIRGILGKRKNVRVLLGEVSGFDLERRRVNVSGIEIGYDYLIVAAGAGHSYFGNDQWAPLAPGLKTIEDALEIRRRVLLAFEVAERQETASGTHRPVHFVVVGAGPTGVELAGTLAEIANHSIPRDFRAINPRETHIVLVEGAPRVLPGYPEDLSRSAERQLRRLGVDVRTSSIVSAMEPGRIRIGDEYIPSTVTLWAAGVSASPLGRQLGAPTDKAGRVVVEPDLSLPGHPEVFVVGDLASFLHTANGKPVPGVAPAAMQEGRSAARNILRDLRNKPRVPFQYKDKGTMATIGRAAAVADVGKLHLSGFPAWLMWLFVHLMYLVGFRNRLLVFIEWAWAYFTYQRSARLITGSCDFPGFARPEGSPEKPLAAD
jgi:NADH:quinone reductase (non-electrogenic)